MAAKSIVGVLRDTPLVSKKSASVRPASRGASPASRVAPIGFHLTLRLSDDRVIARTPAERRLLACVVYAIGAHRGLLAFRAADTHLHIVMVGSRRLAGLLARYVAISLRWRLELTAGFEACRIRPIVDQRHLENAVRYLFAQERHHGIDADPFHEASSLPELLGLRALDDEVPRRLRQHLPRLSNPTPSELPDLVSASLVDDRHLLESTLSAMALPRLGRDPASQRARRAAVHVSTACTSELAKRLRVDPTSVRRWRRLPPEPHLVEAIRRQLRLRTGFAAKETPALK